MNSSGFKFFFLITLLVIVSFQSNAQPFGYYNGIEGKSGEELKTALHEIINGHVDFTYSRAKYIINYSDADPENEDNVILFYLQESRDADSYGTGGDYINREHVWAKSHGSFEDWRPMDGDALNLRPADASVNTTRSNKDFDNVQPNGTQHSEATECWYTSNAWEPGPATKGQVARILFYMATRYEGTDGELDLEVVDELNTAYKPEHGKLSTLIEWNNQYPPSDMERQRNERVFQVQQNRNPFVDNPDLVNYIWNSGEPSANQISNMSITPEKPHNNDDITVSISVEAESTPDSVMLYWSNEFDSRDNKKAFTGNNSNYTTDFNLNGYQPGDIVYFLINAYFGTDTIEMRASHILPENIEVDDFTEIKAIQGETSTSPLYGQEVTLSGRISANFDNAAYVQSSESPWQGICIYNALKTGYVGDSVVIRGSVTEYNGLTEIEDVEYLYNFSDNKDIEPIELTISQISEQYEGLLVTIKNVTFEDGGTTVPESNTSYTFTDGNNEMVLFSAYNSRLVGETLPSETIDLTGIVGQYGDVFQILARDMNDLEVITGVKQLNCTSQLNVFPNPANSVLQIETSKTIKNISIYDLSGRVLKDIQGDNESIAVENLPSGIYLLKASFNDNSVVFQKFVKSE